MLTLFLKKLILFSRNFLHFIFQEPRIVSDRNLAILVRQVALHCNLAAEIQRSVTAGREPRASNWLERLRAIKRIREKVILDLESQERGHGSGNEISAGIWAVIQR